jgi:hypothetical protein
VTQIAFSEIVGRRLRMGAWEDQKVSTYRKIREAVDAQAWDEAAALAHYFVDEAQTCFAIYRQWLGDLTEFLLDNGVDAEELARADAEIVAKLALPDGGPFDPRRQWDAFLTDMETLVAHCHRREPTEALTALDTMKETWRQCHDRDADHAYGLMNEVKVRLGEGAIARMFDRVLMPLFAWRYDKFDIDKHPWDESLETLMLVGCEAMRGHLVGPERTGDFELIETDDRFILRFDPCGTGGRTLRPDEIEGTPPRMEEPYGWAVSEEPHSWNHFEPGVCLYCAHCIVLQEEMPIDRFGYPLRIIDPPRWTPDPADPARRQGCQWQLFKDVAAIPEEYYTRVGRRKPASMGSSATGAAPLEDAGGMPGTG